MPTILITGAGRGLGLELARRFVALGWETLGTVRDPAKGAAMPKGSQTFLCDVTDRAALARLARDLAGKPIDVLFCNAGMFGKRQQSLGSVDWATERARWSAAKILKSTWRPAAWRSRHHFTTSDWWT